MSFYILSVLYLVVQNKKENKKIGEIVKRGRVSMDEWCRMRCKNGLNFFIVIYATVTFLFLQLHANSTMYN